MKGVCIGFTISEHCYWLTKFLWFFSNQSPEVLFPRLAAVAIFCSVFWLVLWVYLCFSSLIRFRWFWSITIEIRDFLRISVIYCKLSQRAWFFPLILAMSCTKRRCSWMEQVGTNITHQERAPRQTTLRWWVDRRNQIMAIFHWRENIAGRLIQRPNLTRWVRLKFM